MLCYRFVDEKAENAIQISDGTYIAACRCPAEVISEGEALVAGWTVRKDEFWSCVADSDGGIDDRRVNPFTCPFRFQDLVFDGTSFVGVYLEEINQILTFGSRWGIEVIDKTDWAGGWGDITEGRHYYFMKTQ